MKQLIHNDWWDVLKPQFESAYYAQLHNFLKEEYSHRTIYPEMHHIFEAFEWTPFSKVKVVILGQDPYHGPHQAHGCSFSVLPGIPVPPSLQNIYKELQSDVGCHPVQHGYLKKWADQGVLLLNATLTVRAHQAGSHQNKGWEQFTDAVIHRLAEEREHLVFILWGSYAQRKGDFIDRSKHLVLKSPHPSPLSAHRGFFGNGHFSKANAYLKEHGIEPIQW